MRGQTYPQVPIKETQDKPYGRRPSGDGDDRPQQSLVFLGRHDLPAIVHAGLEVDVMRPAHFARVLVLDEGIGRKGMVRTTHVAA